MSRSLTSGKFGTRLSSSLNKNQIELGGTLLNRLGRVSTELLIELANSAGPISVSSVRIVASTWRGVDLSDLLNGARTLVRSGIGSQHPSHPLDRLLGRAEADGTFAVGDSLPRADAHPPPETSDETTKIPAQSACGQSRCTVTQSTRLSTPPPGQERLQLSIPSTSTDPPITG